MLDNVLSELATSFALPGLSFNDKGVVALQVRGMGEIELARWRDEGLTVSLFRDFDETRCEKALTLAAPANQHPWPLSVGLTSKGKLGLVMRLEPNQVSLLEIERCLKHMTDLFMELERG